MEEDKGSEKPSEEPSWIVSIAGMVSSAVLGVDLTDAKLSAMPENPLTDFNHEVWMTFLSWRISAAVVYKSTFIALFVYFTYTSYIDGTTKSFISLDNKSGVCKGERGSKTCCEVPQTITGTFLVDAKGRWNTQNGFSYINNNYAITVAGLEYTNEQWEDVMKNIADQLSTIGLKSENRDYAWSMVAWSSFTAQNLDRGFLQFYSTGLVSVMFDKPIVASGVASAASQEAQCEQKLAVKYNPASSMLEVAINLCDEEGEGCPVNPCPDILAPQAMGYDVYNSQETDLNLAISMQSVYTALAVNLGMITLNHLVMVPGDNDRITLLDEMVQQDAIDVKTANHTSSYFDQRFAPVPPIYCHSTNPPVADSNSWESGNAFCLVRIGNTLAYPVTTSYGWSEDGTSYPTACSKAAAKVDGSAAKFYCNQFNINVGLIYYPVDNQNTSSTWTYRPTTSPTQNPTPLSGDPTAQPTAEPTVRPTRAPTAGPTPQPGEPTRAPSTARPTKVPTADPTAKPSRDPTAVPTPSPTAVPTVSLRKAVRRLAAQRGDAVGAQRSAAIHLAAADDDDGDDAAGDDDGGDDDGGSYYYDDDDNPYESYYNYGGGDDDDGADDDGSGTYSGLYYANSATDDFAPLIPRVVDNGHIFLFGKLAAEMLNKGNGTNGDLFVPNNAYYAMVDTVVGTKDDARRSYARDFKKLCSSSVSKEVKKGCAMMAFNFNAANSRDISTYYYQPSSTPAFSNSIYVKSALVTLQKNTPTSLIQTYYSCVLAPWPAFLAAVGIGSSSAGVFLAIGFTVYVYLTIEFLKRVFGAHIPSKKDMLAKQAAEAELKAQQDELARKVVLALRDDLSSGRLSLPCVEDAFKTGHAAVHRAHVAAVAADARVNKVSANKESTVVPYEVEDVEDK